MTWQNRIEGYGECSPAELIANPRNWRLHPNYQQSALSAVLEEVGFVDSIVVNRETGFVVDGHLRLRVALAEGQPTVPVTYVRLTAAEEAAILASHDPISLMAHPDHNKLAHLLSEIPAGDARLATLLGTLQTHNAFGVPPSDLEEMPKPLSQRKRERGLAVRVVIGPYQFDVSPEAWQRWQEQIVAQVGATREAVCAEIARRLRLPNPPAEDVAHVD
ncbi:hypothetical protein FBQ95_17235 [Chloroflexi bacterium CFX3]|nr:hypothetical protein [Chloroflexi bacterium CFX3]